MVWGNAEPILDAPNRSMKSVPDYGVRNQVGDNAAAESWFTILNNEMYHREWFTTRRRSMFAVVPYIEECSNRCWLHSTLGYRTLPASARGGYDP